MYFRKSKHIKNLKMRHIPNNNNITLCLCTTCQLYKYLIMVSHLELQQMTWGKNIIIIIKWDNKMSAQKAGATCAMRSPESKFLLPYCSSPQSAFQCLSFPIKKKFLWSTLVPRDRRILFPVYSLVNEGLLAFHLK